jgi:hypothetical protein
LLLASLLAGCNVDADASGPETSRPSAGGGAPSFGALEQAVGRVLVIGESAAVPLFEREYRGLADPGSGNADSVRCELSAQPDGFVVSIEAAQSRSPATQFAARLIRPSLGTGQFELTPETTDENNVRVRLGEGDALSYFEYELDGSEDPASLCSVAFSSFDRDQIAGTAACRRLGATQTSRDFAPVADEGQSSASVTFDFSCPFHVLAAPGGSAGSGNGGASAGTAGTAVGGFAPIGGTTSIPEKQCVGVNTPCSLRGSASCEFGSGCILDERCSGISSSCYGQIGVYSCTGVRGCVWASSSKSCIGSAWSCSSFSGSLSCIDQPGCSWTSDCTGTAPLCSSLGEVACALEPNCRWE